MNNKKSPVNIAAVICYSNPQEFIVSYVHPHRSQTLSEHLKINRTSQQITVIKSLDKIRYAQKLYSAFLGVVDIEGEKFLLMCQQCKKAVSLQKLESYEISSLDFLSYKEEKTIKELPHSKELYERMRDYYIILKDGFFFSHYYNLSLSFSEQSQNRTADKFVWNRELLCELEKYQLGQYWKTVVIQGFASSFDIFYKGVKVKYMLVTRRSNQKGGTRYFDRGVNDEGFVANFCETEQIIKIDEYCFSDLQIRGSLPIFFQQVGLYTKTRVNRGFQLTHEAYLKHMQKIIKKHKRIFMANLLSMGKRGQKLLTEQIESHIQKEKNQNLKYLYYDFHHKVQGTFFLIEGSKFENVDEMITQLKEMKANLGFYVYNVQTDQVMGTQEGIFRTNCLDCLDRTNFFQAKLAIITVQNIFKLLNITDLDLLSEMRNNRQNSFIKRFRNIWADNGDAVSWHYTGTGSTHTDITRDGKRGLLGNIKHKYKSITRFYNQNFWDFYKMKIVNMLLGTHKDLNKLNVGNRLKERQTQYIYPEKINIFIFTWKAPKITPSLLPPFPNDVDLIVISVQDLVEYENWIKIITQAVPTSFVKVDFQCISENLLIIFVRDDQKGRISAVEQGNIKFSSYYNTFMSNKSANFIRLNADNSKLVFVGCQLEKGREFSQNRIKNLKEIHQYAFQMEEVGIQKSETILFDDAIFLMGNMNTRVSSSFRNQFCKLSTNDTKNQQNIIRKMMATDQFQRIKMNLLEYRVYEEGNIDFLPTYKYLGGSLDPDHSGWTDRIWFSSEGKIKCDLYDVIKDLRQEHLPVIGRFVVDVKRINEQEQQRIGEQIMKEQEVVKQDLQSVSDDQQEDDKIQI